MITQITPRIVRRKVKRALANGATVRSLSALAGVGRSAIPRAVDAPETMSFRVLSALDSACDRLSRARDEVVDSGGKAV